MLSEADELLYDYLSYPDKYWGDNDRQLAKSKARMKLCLQYYGFNKKQLVNFLVRVSEERIRNECTTLYLPSFGSSGSHLFQHVISLAVPTIKLGEVYIPDLFESNLSKLPREDRFLFMEMYNLASSSTPWMIPSRGVLINTAHKAKLQFFSENTKKYRSMLICRNLVDLVISRTFRKNEFRKYIGKHEVEDWEYLEDNIKKTINFYKGALSYNFDGYLRFEDFFDPNLGHERISNSISGVLEVFNKKMAVKDAIPVALSDDKETNKFSGDRVEVPDRYIEHAKERLSFMVNKVDDIFS